MLDLLHGVAGQARHAPPREGVVQHQPEHLVKHHTFLSGLLLDQGKPWVALELMCVGEDTVISHVMLTYTIYHPTLLLRNAYDIMVFDYDVTDAMLPMHDTISYIIGFV